MHIFLIIYSIIHFSFSPDCLNYHSFFIEYLLTLILNLKRDHDIKYPLISNIKAANQTKLIFNVI